MIWLLSAALAATPAPAAPVPATAPALAPPPVVAAIEAKYAKVNTLTAAFTQTVHNPVYGDDVQVGTLTIKRPGKMFWDFTGDGRQYATDGAMLWIWTKEDNQILRYKGYTPSGAESLLQSLDRLDALFTVTLPAVPVPGSIALDLVPREATAVTQVRLVMSPSYDLQKVVLTDPYGATTDLVFTDVKVEVPVADSVFAMPSIPGVSVIDAGAP